MNPQIEAYNNEQIAADRQICTRLAKLITEFLPEAESKVWHAHPVWFLDGNPTLGYSKQKAGIRLMFWSGSDFGEEQLKAGTGKFKDASVFFNDEAEISESDLQRWLQKSREIQLDYKNIVKRKGKLERLK